MKGKVYFVSGIDTGIGKTYATGYLAKMWNDRGVRTITQKLVQTGNEGMSEDILLHRKIMGCGLLPEDVQGLTMPEIYSYPCSPHLAAEIDGRPIDFGKIDSATAILAERYDAVLVEGAGGLMVPLTRDFLTVDFIASRGYPLIFVTSGRLGSINHLLLSLEAVQRRNIPLHAVVYNRYPADDDKLISEDTENYARTFLSEKFPAAEFILLDPLPGFGY